MLRRDVDKEPWWDHPFWDSGPGLALLTAGSFVAVFLGLALAVCIIRGERCGRMGVPR